MSDFFTVFPFFNFQLQQYKQGVIPTNVPAVEDKPKENGQVDLGDQVINVNNKVISF